MHQPAGQEEQEWQNKRQRRGKRRRRRPQVIRSPHPALQVMEPANRMLQREEYQCNNQPDKRHESGGTRGNGATRGAGSP